jgi:hypothetical protein
MQAHLPVIASNLIDLLKSNYQSRPLFEEFVITRLGNLRRFTLFFNGSDFSLATIGARIMRFQAF